MSDGGGDGGGDGDVIDFDDAKPKAKYLRRLNKGGIARVPAPHRSSLFWRGMKGLVITAAAATATGMAGFGLAVGGVVASVGLARHWAKKDYGFKANMKGQKGKWVNYTEQLHEKDPDGKNLQYSRAARIKRRLWGLLGGGAAAATGAWLGIFDAGFVLTAGPMIVATGLGIAAMYWLFTKRARNKLRRIEKDRQARIHGANSDHDDHDEADERPRTQPIVRPPRMYSPDHMGAQGSLFPPPLHQPMPAMRH